MLLFGLRMEGYLFLGSSENPVSIIRNLQVVNKKWKLYKNLESKRVVNFDAFSFQDLPAVKHAGAPFPVANEAARMDSTLFDNMQENLALEMDYLAICVDENNSGIGTCPSRVFQHSRAPVYICRRSCELLLEASE